VRSSIIHKNATTDPNSLGYLVMQAALAEAQKKPTRCAVRSNICSRERIPINGLLRRRRYFESNTCSMFLC
jgi:hypothetical protein